jgi:hypothetical protein
LISKIVSLGLAALSIVSFSVTPAKVNADAYGYYNQNQYGNNQYGGDCCNPCPPPCDPCCPPPCDPCCPPKCSNTNMWAIAGSLLLGAAAGAGAGAAVASGKRGKHGHDGRRGPTGDPGVPGPTGPGIPALPAGTFLESFTVDGVNTLTFELLVTGVTLGTGTTVTPFVVLPNNVVVQGTPVALTLLLQTLALPPVPAIFGDYQVGIFLENTAASIALTAPITANVTASRDGSVTNEIIPAVATTILQTQAETVAGFAYGLPPIP